MIEEIHLDTWSEFAPTISDLVGSSNDNEGEHLGFVSGLLFRGQADHNWNLESTLERHTSDTMSLLRYYRLVSITQSEVQAFTNKQWTLPSYEQLSKTCRSFDSDWQELPGYDYLAYLRHHSFPSPLLDWSKSPFVAAYFAFANSSAERVAIYAYQETTGVGKITSSDETLIRALGPYVNTHTRHFLQRSEYTICWSFREGEWVFGKYQDMIGKRDETQDRFWKITLPIGVRTEALSYLDQHNLNEFSLFQTEESLLRSLWLREYTLNKKRR